MLTLSRWHFASVVVYFTQHAIMVECEPSDAHTSKGLLQGLRRVMAPKASTHSAWQGPSSLHPLTSHAAFSSIASLLGSPGQAAYAAANGTLDGAASMAAAQGLPHVSIQWGAWAGGGMAARDAATSARLQRLGLGLITPHQGLRALAGILQGASRCSGEPVAAGMREL